MTETNPILPGLVRQLLAARCERVSISHLADRAGCSTFTIKRILNGEDVPAASLVRVAVSLGLVVTKGHE
jgi:hypothetical protein